MMYMAEKGCGYSRWEDCFPLYAKRVTKASWIGKHELVTAFVSTVTGVVKRHMAKVVNGGRDILMDAITGTMYDAGTGKCMSSDKRLIVSVGAADVAGLMSAKCATDYSDASRRAVDLT